MKKSRRVWLVALAGLIAVSFLVTPELAIAQGKSRDKRGPLSKITFIHYRKAPAKPERPGKPPKEPKEPCYYEFIGRGLKWKDTAFFVIDPGGYDTELVQNAVLAGMEEWDVQVDFEIFDDGLLVAPAAPLVQDYINAIGFGEYPDANVIAVTYLWGYFTGPPGLREIIETDILFNTGFEWGDATVDPNLMDIQNIATHELGHCAGMGDLYEDVAAEETMYGYSTEGETKKRDLACGDIKGIIELY